MSIHKGDLSDASREQWLKLYYFARTAFSAVWVAAAFTVGQHSWVVAAVLLVAYPAWDAFANFVDASRSGGLGQNRTQAINVVVSVATTLAVVLALEMSMNWVLGVFGVWAILSGLLQLGTAVRRWKSYGAQWAMILSGGQSALAGTFFIVQARMPRLIYGCPDPKAGAVRTLFRLCEDDRLNHQVIVEEGVLAEECAQLLREFFRAQRAMGKK